MEREVRARPWCFDGFLGLAFDWLVSVSRSFPKAGVLVAHVRPDAMFDSVATATPSVHIIPSTSRRTKRTLVAHRMFLCLHLIRDQGLDAPRFARAFARHWPRDLEHGPSRR